MGHRPEILHKWPGPDGREWVSVGCTRFLHNSELPSSCVLWDDGVLCEKVQAFLWSHRSWAGWPGGRGFDEITLCPLGSVPMILMLSALARSPCG